MRAFYGWGIGIRKLHTVMAEYFCRVHQHLSLGRIRPDVKENQHLRTNQQ